VDEEPIRKKSTNPYAQSQRDQVASDSAQKQQKSWKKTQRTFKNPHGRLQKGRKSWVRGENTRSIAYKKTKTSKYGLQCRTRSNHRSKIHHQTEM
jgi:hypothetical protein